MKLINRKDKELGKCYLTYRALKGCYKIALVYELDGLYTMDGTYIFNNQYDLYHNVRSGNTINNIDINPQDDIVLYELDEEESFRMYHMIKIIEAL